MRVMVRPSKVTLRDFEAGTGGLAGMASPVCGGLEAMWSWGSAWAAARQGKERKGEGERRELHGD